jgi:hypothetical protein
VVTFEDAGDGGTEMTVTEHGYATEEAGDLSRMGMEQRLDKMAVIFAGAWIAPLPKLSVRCVDSTHGRGYRKGEPRYA